MSKVKIKIAGVLTVYALLITTVFVAGILSISSYSGKDNVNIYLQSDLMEVDKSANMRPNKDGDNLISDERIEDLEKYADYYHNQFMNRIIILAVIFCAFLIVSSVILWIILKKIQKEENARIAQQLHSIQDMHDFVSDDPILAQAFMSIKDEFDRHMTDYKRLHTYLSHEQKNALSLLRTNLELHHEDECLKNIEEISMEIDELVILSENKDAGSVPPIDMIMLCAEVADKYAAHYPLIDFEFPDEELYITAKPRWIRSALSNLIDNAVKYGQNQKIQIRVWGTTEAVMVSVKDQGLGIPKEKQKEIFAQNYRINELNKDGYGIGLSLVKHVCMLCKGSVVCKSELNQGSEFIMTFPRFSMHTNELI